MESCISVIVPVYNVEKYLTKCVHSIMNQTHSNLEIILVDDGSTDSCGLLCDVLAKTDTRIKVIHKANGGLSDARNAGMAVMTGSYVGFVDSDDFIEPDMYEQLLRFALDNQLDVAMCASCNEEEDGTIKPGKPISFDPIVTSDKNEMIYQTFVNPMGGLSVGVCNKLYKRDVLKDIRFAVDKTAEDVFFILKWIQNTDRYGRISEPMYHYLHRKGSITHLTKWNENIYDVIDGYQLNLQIITRTYPKSMEYGEYRLLWAYYSVSQRILKCCDWEEHQREFRKIRWALFKYALLFFTNPYASLKMKLGSIVLALSPDMYIALKKPYERTKDRNRN